MSAADFEAGVKFVQGKSLSFSVNSLLFTFRHELPSTHFGSFHFVYLYAVASSGIKLSNDVKLAFYSLFKQATDGPCNEKAPSRLRIIEYSKWKAWADLKQYV